MAKHDRTGADRTELQTALVPDESVAIRKVPTLRHYLGTVSSALKSAIDWVWDNAFVVVLALSIGLLAFTEYYPWFKDHPHWQMFLKEVAFAGIIASFVSLT